MKTKLLLGLVLAAGLVPVACGADRPVGDPGGTLATTAPDPPAFSVAAQFAAEGPQPGDEAATANTTAVVHSAHFANSYRYTVSAAKRLMTAPEGSVYLVVDAAVTNSGTAKRFGGGGDFSVTTADGASHDPLEFGGDEALGFTLLFLGQTLGGMLVFELPADTARATLVHGPSDEPSAVMWRLERSGG